MRTSTVSSTTATATGHPVQVPKKHPRVSLLASQPRPPATISVPKDSPSRPPPGSFPLPLQKQPLAPPSQLRSPQPRLPISSQQPLVVAALLDSCPTTRTHSPSNIVEDKAQHLESCPEISSSLLRYSHELSQQLQAQQQFALQSKDQKRDQPVQPPQPMPSLHMATPQGPQPQPNLPQQTPQSRLQHPHQQRPPNLPPGAQHPNMLHHYTQLQNGQQIQPMLRRLGNQSTRVINAP